MADEIRVGDLVSFERKGRVYRGRVTYIAGNWATVVVPVLVGKAWEFFVSKARLRPVITE